MSTNDKIPYWGVDIYINFIHMWAFSRVSQNCFNLVEIWFKKTISPPPPKKKKTRQMRKKIVKHFLIDLCKLFL